ncbi:hypothetical protein J6590_079389, partial [Homalodisca vitripennis]
AMASQKWTSVADVTLVETQQLCDQSVSRQCYQFKVLVACHSQLILEIASQFNLLAACQLRELWQM